MNIFLTFHKEDFITFLTNIALIIQLKKTTISNNRLTTFQYFSYS